MNASSKYPGLKKLKQKLADLNNLRTEYILQLASAGPMIHGLAYGVFKKCGKKNCKCASGRLHGPYPALSVNKNGMQKIMMIKKDDVSKVLEKSERFRHFQQTRTRIRRINREIDELLEKIKNLNISDYR